MSTQFIVKECFFTWEIVSFYVGKVFFYVGKVFFCVGDTLQKRLKTIGKSSTFEEAKNPNRLSIDN